MSKSIRQRHCFVPGCKNDGRQKLSLFAVPADHERFKVWKEALSVCGKALEKKCVVCERHFENRYVCKSYKHTINGELVEIPRNRPLLLPEAVPTRNLARLPRSRRRTSNLTLRPRPGRPRKNSSGNCDPDCAEETEATVEEGSPASREYCDEDQTGDRHASEPEGSECISSDSCDDVKCVVEVNMLTPPPVTATPAVKRTLTPHIVTARKASPPLLEKTISTSACVPSSAAAVPVTPVVPCGVVSVKTAASTPEQPVASKSSAAYELRVTKNPLSCPPIPGVEAPAFLAKFNKALLPNRYWSLHYVQHSSRHVAFSFCAMFGGRPTLTKMVTCEENSDGTITCQATVDGVDVKTASVEGVHGVLDFLNNLDALAFCQGAASAAEFSTATLDNCKVHGDRLHSMQCNLLTPASSRLCDLCRHLRKVLQNRAAYMKRKASSSSQVVHATRESAVAGTEQVTSTRTDKVPDAEKLLVQTCIQASKRSPSQVSGNKGAQTENEEWTVECTFIQCTPLQAPQVDYNGSSFYE
uniref:THAP-type domain-containing protein n=1 Tax=Amblyomma maculatum TaxID=34609 RepID=G3MKB0_AMBMU